jgi:hypothetical protein
MAKKIKAAVGAISTQTLNPPPMPIKGKPKKGKRR